MNNMAALKFGFRGENIYYEIFGKTTEISFTWINGPRLYTESIHRWNDGSLLSEEEKHEIFNKAIGLIKQRFNKAIVVINVDDDPKQNWERQCLKNKEDIENIEYTSDEENIKWMKKEHLDTMKKTGLLMDGIKITTEEELDIVLKKCFQDIKKKRL
jgi:hypothetical protein